MQYFSSETKANIPLELPKPKTVSINHLDKLVMGIFGQEIKEEKPAFIPLYN